MWGAVVIILGVKWALLLLAVGCGVPPLPLDRSKLVAGPEGAETAAAFVCAELESNPCPPVYWYGPESMNCNNGGGFIAPSGNCVEGLQGSDGILLGYLYDGQPAHDTSLTHETAHWKFGDEDHRDAALWLRVAELNTALAEMGL